MQDKDSEVLNYQRKRRKRITKIRYSIILIVAGWIVLSMILVVVLFVKMTSLEHKLDQLVTSSSEQMGGWCQPPGLCSLARAAWVTAPSRKHPGRAGQPGVSCAATQPIIFTFRRPA